MNRDISRRDFANGVAVAVGALALPGTVLAAAATQPHGRVGDDYPPARTGMRGSHEGSFEAAHELRDRRMPTISGAQSTGETYDLVIVGAGLSGLAAAHYFHKNVGAGAKVLVLDNHDDFGGHAKRNEFEYNGKMLAINGGTLNIESPSRYNPWAKELLTDIGVDLDRCVEANKANETLYSSFGLRGAYFFDKETFATDRLVVAPAGEGRRAFSEEYVRNMPISERAKQDLLRLEHPEQPDYLPGLSSAQKKERLARMSYQDYLLNVARIDEQAYWFHMAFGRSLFGVGADATPALFAWQMGSRAFSGLKLDPSPEGLLANLPGGQHGRQKEGGPAIHFPDGNATLARLLVRRLIPAAVPGSTQEDVGAARVNYPRHHREPLATRILVHLQQSVRSLRMGVHAVRLASVCHRTATLWAHFDRECGRSRKPAHGRGLPRSASCRHRGAGATR